LQLAFEFWLSKQESRLMPIVSDLASEPELIAAIFVFLRRHETDDWEVMPVASEAVILLGSGSLGKWQLRLHTPRITARLRRVFKTVAESKAFLAAAFEQRVGQCLCQLIEILAAQQSSNGRRVDGMYRGLRAARR
jgi:hypothetical protein